MHTNFYEKFKESALTVAPVMFVVLLLNFTFVPLGDGQLGQFLLGGFLLIVGLAIFLLGTDIGIVPFGQKVGSSLTQLRRLWPMLVATLAIGFAVTIAEPDVQLLAIQVTNLNPDLSRPALIGSVALGVGVFIMIGILRVILRLSLPIMLSVFYLLVFIVAYYAGPNYAGVAFDSGGVTTGPVTVPFIMALGLGVAATAKKSDSQDAGFGLVGLASIGPVLAVAFLGVMMGDGAGSEGGESSSHTPPAGLSLVDHFLHIVPQVTSEISMALVPIIFIFLICQLTLLKLPRQQLRRIITGFVYTFIGLVIFMTGVSGGFSPVGSSLGQSLATYGAAALIPVGLILGAVVVCAEPAVWVLTKQVEDLSNGYIRRTIMITALSVSVALAVVLGLTRVLTGLSIWYFLIPGYLIALSLTRLTPPLFTAVAFDSGGVASGPMSAAFLLSLTLGASISHGGNPTTDAFGMVAMIAMAPLITIQILGIIFKIKEEKALKRRQGKGI